MHHYLHPPKCPYPNHTCSETAFLINHSHLLVVLHIDLGLLPLASRYLAVEHDVDLAVGAALHLRQPEVCADQAEQTSATPDVTALAAEVSALCYVSDCQRRTREGRLTVGLSM